MKFNSLTPNDILKTANRFWPKVDKTEPDKCWNWNAGKTRFGYGKFQITKNKKSDSFNAHRVAYFLVHPEQHPSVLLVLHACDNPACVNPNHLRLGNTADNAQDRSKRGRNSRPMHKAKISHEIAREIRRAYAIGGTSMKEIGLQLGISWRQVQRIVHNEQWKVKPIEPPRLYLHV